ncbi:MAG: putative DNA binding domain-containing protein [Desulfotomaculum sp.]|nr:putative DNA binding domain-containing protein [Desulfotomaculum sp.]
MDAKELSELISKGEDSQTQFKEKFSSIDALTAEIVAFLNTNGGQIIVGITDNGQVKGLSNQEIQQLNQWIANACQHKIEPAVSRVTTQNIKYKDKLIILIKVPLGINKFYLANNRDVWVKIGADKRRAGREELKRLLQESNNMYADETSLPSTSIEKLDLRLFERFYQTRTGEAITTAKVKLENILNNLKLMRNDNLTLAGVLIFGKEPQKIIPYALVKAVSFVGNDAAGLNYRDSQDFTGNLEELFKQGLSFLLSNLKHQQQNQDFNTTGIPEIPKIALEEALANALLHRNYFLASNIRLFIFDNRVEIISPGLLPNSITIEGIKLGLHLERNPILVSIGRDLEGIPYRGVGTGILRIIKECQKQGVPVDFIAEKATEQFKVIFYRQQQN